MINKPLPLNRDYNRDYNETIIEILIFRSLKGGDGSMLEVPSIDPKYPPIEAT